MKRIVAAVLLGLLLAAAARTAPVSAQNPTGREIQINFSVLVQDVANARVPGAKVTATDQNGKAKTLATDRNGRCRFEQFQQGRMKISVTAPGFADGSVDQDVVNKQEVAITLRLPEK